MTTRSRCNISRSTSSARGPVVCVVALAAAVAWLPARAAHAQGATIPTPAVTIADAGADEGDAITFAVTLDKAVSGGFTVTPSFTDGTATAGTDYTASAAALAFAGAAGERQTFAVATTEDADVEGDETFTVGLAVSGTSHAVTATSTATGTIRNDDADPYLGLNSPSVTEGDAGTTTMTFTARLSDENGRAKTSSKTITASYRVSSEDGATATAGTDYRETSGSLTFAPGETVGTIDVTVLGDTEDEDDETVTLRWTGWSDVLLVSYTGTGTIVDDDDPPPAAVTIADASASEGEAITFTVTLDNAVPGGLTVTPSFTDGTATAGTDYTASVAALAFAGAAGERQTFAVATTEDADVEGDETFTVGLAVSGTSHAVTATSTATGTIRNDDADPYLGLNSPSVTEGDAGTTTMTFTARLSDENGRAKTSSKTITASYRVSSEDGATATAGTDYRETSGSLTFAPGETVGTIDVTVLGDTEDEDDETVTLRWTGWSDVLLVSYTGTGTIVDDDDPPPAAVTIADASASEGEAITFAVTLDNAVPGGLTVTPSFTDGTATAGTDYTENTTALSFRGTAGETQTFAVATTDDADVEGDETFTVGLAVSGTSHSVTATSTATGTITNDDIAPPATVTIADASASEGESITFGVTLDRAVSGGLTVTPSFTDGTATAGTDYTENTAALTFAGTAGETRTFTVSTTEDSDVEGDETFTVGLAVSGTSHSVTATSTATGTITNDDIAPAAAVTIADASASEGEAITFTVTLDKAVAGGLKVTPSFTDGTATKGTDYTENTAALTFAGTAGETRTFTVATTEDSDVEGDETFTVGLSVSGTSHAVTATSTATGTITNDDQAAVTVPALSIADAKAIEGKSIAFTVTLDKAVAGGFKVTPTFTDVTATKGTDYTANTTALDFAGTAGESVSFTVPTTDDADSEEDETFTVGLSVSGTSHGVTATATATGTITDNDGASAEWHYGAKLSAAPDSVSENGGSQKVTVTADVSEWGVSTSDQSYVVTVGKGGDGAVSGVDYKAVSKFQVIVPKGRRSGSNSFNLEPIADNDWEGDETITIHASGPDGAQSTTLTLTDEGDRPYGGPQVTLSANPSKVSEADGATTVTVTATSAAHSVSRKVTVTVGATGTATSGTDYAAVSNFDITLAAKATSATGTFTLTPTQDKLAEGDETIALSGNVEGVSGKLTGTTLTLTDDEPTPNVALSVSPSSVTENGGAKTVTVTATSSAAAANARTLLVAVGNRQDTATPGTDYTVVPAFNITIAANATSATGTFTLTPTDDTSVEDTESISIDGSPESAGAAFTVGEAAMTLTDDDAQPAVTLTVNPSSVGEAALATSVTVKATAASAVAWARTVTVSVGKTGSAASGTDYAAVSDFTITIAANALSGTGTFTLKPIQDITNEGNETIGVSGTSPRTTVTSATVTLADDDINPPVTLSVSPSSVGEGASATTVTVTATADSAIATARTVSVKVGGGTATPGTDYAAVSNFTITIAANATSGTGTFTLTPTQDTSVEGGETIGVSGSSTGTTVTGTTVALTDDDTYPAVTLSVNPSSVSESASATTVTVTATAASSISPARAVTVSVGQTGTAASGSDYAAVTDFTITIAANATSATGTFTLTPTQDTEVEHNETIGVDGSSPNTTVTNATITLTDDDKDAVTLSLSRRTLGEEAGATSITVTATAATAIAAARTVSVSVGGSGTATSGTDYAAVSDFDITIAANATSGTGSFTLTPTQDTNNEGNETIGVAGTNSLSTVTGTTLTLVDDDQPTISLTAGTAAFSESWSGTINVTATRSGSTTSAVAVTIIVGRDTDSATEGVDYTEVADYTITIPAGQTSASKGFTVSGKRDFVADNNERFSIGGLATGYKVSDVPNGVGIFEWYATIGLTTDVSSVSEHDGATTVTVTAHIHPTVYGNVYVSVSVGGGTATSGTDYAAVSNFTITIPNKASSATGTFTLTPTQDALLESDETININGSGSHWNFYAGQGTSMTLTDAQPITLLANPSSISEGASATQVAVTATATGTVSTPRTVTVAVGDTGTATSGTDYVAVSDFDIVIPANKTGATNTFTLTPTKDSAGEGDETIGVSGSSTVTYVYPTTLTLTDTNPAVTLTAAPSTISEGASGTSVTVTATAASAIATPRTVTVAVGGSGTATSGTDYAAVSDFTITIAANATSGTGSFTLTPTQDTALEGDETIGVSGTSSEAATISGTTLTLTDDDLPTITLTTVPAKVTVAEGAGRSSVTVRATAAAAMKDTATVTLTVGASGDGATSGTDYTTSNVRTITIPKGQARGEASFELTPTQDTSVEGDEMVSVSGSSSGGHTVIGTSLTLSDDDKHQLTLSASPSSVGEGASATSVTVTATAKSAVSSARTVTVSVGGSGTATSGTDYAAVSDFTITIAANATSGTGTFTLTPTQDTDVEGSETIGVAGTSAQSTVTGTSVTLTDDDSYPAVTLSASPSSVGEGASGTQVTVTATAASSISSARTVTVSVGGSGTATTGVDYATVADFTITIAANATSGTGTFTLTPKQDTDVEGSETIGVSGASPSSTVTGTTVTLTDDDTHSINLSASPTTVAENKASEQITVTATINVARASATQVTVSVGESGDQATSGTDYKAVSDFTVTIAANATSGTGTFTFEPLTDQAYEGFESVTISGTTSSGGGANAQNASVNIPVTGTSLTIHDASNYPALTLTAAPSSVSEGAGATSVTVTATATSSISSSREVTVSVGGGGTATSGTDYAAVSSFIIKIPADSTSATGTFTLTPTADDVVEGSETIGVAGASRSTTVTGTTVTLTDDDNAAVTVDDASAAEGSDITFTVTLDKAVQGGLTVTPDFTDVTAVEGTDYDENTTALSFTGTAGETQTITVSTTQDAVVETDETFTVGLTVSNAPSGVTSTDTGTGTINDDTSGNVDNATVTINDASADEGGSITFTVTLDNAVQGGLTVTPSYTNGTAASGDYTTNTTGLSFTGTANETKTFTVSTTEDAVLEADETFTVGLTVSGTTLASRITATDTGTGTINNDDGATVTVNNASASEGADITFTVTLGAAVQGGLTVTPDFTDVTAVEGTDYDENTSGLSFTGTANETKTFTVSTTEDAVLEADETFTVGLTVSGTTLASRITSTDTGTGTINNDDAATVTVNNGSASEGDSITFTVTLGTAVQGGLTVTPGFTDVTAVEGTDYDANTAGLDFTGTKGETKSFKVATTEDAVLEADETFTVDLTVSNTSLSITATDTGTGTVTNDDAATVTVNNASASEGADITFTVTLGAAVQGGLTVTPDFTDVTAVEGTDYDENTSGLSFTGTANETKTFTVLTTEDAVLEADETFTVGLTVSGTTLTSRITSTDTGTGTINNDDAATVTVNNGSASEGDSITFTVTLGTAVQGGLTVTPGFTDVTAVEGTDYDANTAGLDFTGTKGETKSFKVATTEDAVLEADETFTVDLTVSNTSLSITATDTGTGTVTNDDAATVTVNDASASEGDSITFTVTLDEAVQGGLTVTPGYTNGTATSGDYTANTAALSFTGTKGETKSLKVATTEDAVLEANETFTVGLTVSNAPSGVTSTDTGAGTIDNDDDATVTIDDVGASEGAGIIFTITLDKAVQGGLTVTPGYTNGTAESGDYTANTNTMSFTGTANETKTFTVATTEDAVLEENETFTVGLTVSDAPSGVISTDTGVGTINDDDGADLSLTDPKASEGESLTFTVTLNAAVEGGLTVTPGFTDGTAVEGTDYDENTTALSFTGTKGETKSFTVATTEDAVLEADETFTVGLTVSKTSLDIDATATGTGTINNDDATEVTVADASASEGEGITFTVTLSEAVQGGLTVTPGYTDGTAVEGTDYNENTTALSFTGTRGETKTFTVSTTEDAVLEADETFTVGLTVSGAPSGVTSTDTGTGTIDNDDGAEVTIADANASEGESMTFTVTLSDGVQGGLTVTPYFTDSTAVEGTDYDENTTALTFTGTKGETETFTVSTTEDSVAESDETFTIGLTTSGTPLTVASTDTGIGTIDDDDPASDVRLSVDSARVEEDTEMTVTVTAELVNGNTFPQDRTVTVSVGGGTATAHADYAAVSDFNIVIPEDRLSATGTFTLSPVDDDEVEGDETIELSGVAGGLTVHGATMTLLDDDQYGIALSASPSTVDEDASATEVTVTATAKTADTEARVVTVTVGAGGDGATEGTDYAAVGDFQVTIPANATSGTGTFTLAPVDDDEVEGDEAISVTGASWRAVVRGTTVTLVEDDRHAVRLSVVPARVSEAASDTLVRVMATAETAVARARVITVAVGDADDGATAGVDYAAVADFDVTIPANVTSGSKVFRLTPVDDDEVEGDEAISVTGSGANLTVKGAVLTLVDNDGDTVRLTARPASVSEDASATEVTVTAEAETAVLEARVVAVAVGGGTATEGVDYVPVADFGFTVTIPANATSGTGTFTLTPTDDDVVEGDETILVTGSGANLTVKGAVLTLVDNDGDTVRLTARPASVSEDASATEVTVTAEAETAVLEARVVAVAVGGGTATEGVDYVPVADFGFTVTIPANATSGTGTFTLTPTDDDVVEGDETILVTGSGANMTVQGTSVTLADDDEAVVALSVDPGSVEEGTATEMTVTASLLGGLVFAEARTVTVSVSDGTATAGADYAAVAGFDIAIPAGGSEGSAVFTLATTSDGETEGDETIRVTGSSSPGTEVLPAQIVVRDAAGARAAPVARDDRIEVEEGGTVSVLADGTASVLANDSIPAGDLSVALSGDGAAYGDLVLNADGTFTYTHDGSENHADGFAYTASAGDSISAPATVVIAVEPVNDAPVARDDTVTVVVGAVSNRLSNNMQVDRSGPARFTVLANDSDAESSSFELVAELVTVAAADGGSSGDFELRPDGTFRYIHKRGGAGTDLFSYVASDGEKRSNPATVHVTIMANDGPLFNGGYDFDLLENRDGSTAPVELGRVEAEDPNVEAGADELEYVIAAGPEGLFSVDPKSGEIAYVGPGEDAETPPESYALTVRATDTGGLSDSTVVRVRVVDENERPHGTAIPDQTIELGATATLGLGGHFSDPDGDTLIYAAQAERAGIVEVVIAGDSVAVTSVGDGPDRVRVTVVAADRGGLSAEQSFDVEVVMPVEEATRALELSLAGIGRTIATQAVDAIGGRFEASSRLARAEGGGLSGASAQGIAAILQAGGVDMDDLAMALDIFGGGGLGVLGGGMGGGAEARGLGFGGLGGGLGFSGMGGGMRAGGLAGRPSFANGGAVALGLGSNGAGAGGWTLWGSGARTDFSGRPDGFSIDGSMDAAYLGVDRSLGSSGVVGVAVSRNQGGVDFSGASHLAGDVEARLTTVYPYVRWSPTGKTDLWGVVGLGRGDVEMNAAGTLLETPGRLRMAAMGLRNDLARVGAVDLAVRADAFAVGMEADAVAGMVGAADGRAQRLRLVLDGSADLALSPSSRLTPSVEVGARADGGDVETGPGMELGGGLAFANARLGLDIAARARWLAVHRDEHFGEWGGNLSVKRMPATPERGLSFSLEPAWGEDASGIAALWEGRSLGLGGFGSGLRPEDAEQAWRPDRLDMEIAYGAGLPAGRGSLKPFGRLMMMGAGSRHLRVGTRLEFGGGDGPNGGLALELLGEQRAQAGGAAVHGAGVNLKGANLRAAGGLFAPFGEVTVEGASSQRLTFGTLMHLAGDAGTGASRGLRLQLAAEAYRRVGEAPKYGLVLRGASGMDD